VVNGAVDQEKGQTSLMARALGSGIRVFLPVVPTPSIHPMDRHRNNLPTVLYSIELVPEPLNLRFPTPT